MFRNVFSEEAADVKTGHFLLLTIGVFTNNCVLDEGNIACSLSQAPGRIWDDMLNELCALYCVYEKKDGENSLFCMFNYQKS